MSGIQNLPTTPYSPATFEKLFPSIQLAKSSKWTRRMAKWLAVLLVTIITFTIFTPWQQFVGGSGRVVAYDPLMREQIVQSPISGRVAHWVDGVSEGFQVKKGQTIVEIQDLDPDLLIRLNEQLEATQRELKAKLLVVEAYQAQVEAFKDVRIQTIAAAEEYIKMSQQKLKAEEQNLTAVKAAALQVEADFERQKQLADEGLASKYKEQVARRKKQEVLAKVEQAKAYIASATSNIKAKKNEREAKKRETQAKIDSSNAQLSKAQGDLAKTEKELVALKVKLTQQKSQVVTAPRDGFIFKLDTFQQGAIVKKGDALFTLVPQMTDRAVEIWLKGNDASWVTPGQHVRLQFEGWPGIQSAGWPSVAVNTFGGEVAVVDSTDNGKGKFRVLIRPATDDDPWPSKRFLRQGVRTNALVMLEQVPLWYEVWRQLNGFPPVVEMEKSSGAKKSKLK